ncbi:MAG: 8-oxo-dGTP pyrophosphatase MutT (NUDIX family) [Myxococcota bacterium]|jgi:8-oxo-dGTP pyrophosphatase MutT (NUDIX family)
MLPLTLEAVHRALSDHDPIEHPALPGRTNHRKAGILLPLQPADNDLRCTLIQRSTRLRDHPGEIGFPGGKREPADRSLADTALRETHEELGLSGLRLLGRLSSFPLFTSDYRLEPFVAAVPPGMTPTPEPGEVAAVVTVSLRDLLERSHTEAIAFDWEGREVLSPVFFGLAARPLYGGSAHVLWELLSLLGEPPPLRAGRYQWADLKAP